MSDSPQRDTVIFSGGGTGGHLYPAIALAEAVQRLRPETEILFLGAARGVEARVLPEREIPHRLLPFEPIRRSRPWENWRLFPSLLRSGMGIARAFREVSPRLVVGTGGYASGPTVGWATLRGIPTAVQEQNSYPGITTRWLSSRVDQIHLAFPEAREYLRPGKRTQLFEHGNPITPPPPSPDRTGAREAFALGEGPVALVVGGSQGARAINEALVADLRGAVDGRLDPFPDDLQILWATGPTHHESVSTRIGEMGLEGRVRTLPYIQDMPAALAAADFAVSRAGAMALAELCAWGIPAVLVPFPYASANHQHHNAMALGKAGAAVVVPETEMEPGRLWSEMRSLAADPERREAMASRARERGRPDAAEKIARDLISLMGGER